MKNLMLALLMLLMSSSVFGAVPNLIPVQGVLTEVDGTPVSGDINLTLSLYNSKTNTSELWKEQRDDFAVENGYISLYLGEVTELSPSIMLNADELWLEIVFNNERMPRVRLASVPFAIEAINAQRAKQIGDITETQITNMFNSACNDGYYLQGYTEDGNAICAEDKTGDAKDPIVYNAGNGIEIDESNIISVSDNLYSAGDGIKLESGIISVDRSKVADALHNHDTLYYAKSNNATNNSLVKFSGDAVSGYKLENTGISEANGELTVNSLVSTTSISAETGNITNLTSTTSDITNLTSASANITSLYSNYINLDSEPGRIDTRVIKAKEIEFANHDASWAVETRMRGMKSVSYPVLPSSAGNYSVEKRWLSLNGTLTEALVNGSSLHSGNSFCSLSYMSNTGFNGDTQANSCKVSIDEYGYWTIEAMHSWTSVTCQARCLVWNW